MNIVALIPARGGSKRIPGKNIKPLGGKPLIQWTIEAAQQSGVFSRIVVSSDSDAVLKMAGDLIWQPMSYTLHFRRPEHARDDSPDIQWVRDALGCAVDGVSEDAFAILRPTSPFRTADTIRRAWDQFKDSDRTSLRAIERWHGPHPGKMWTYCDTTVTMFPVMNEWTGKAPYHSSPTQSLVPVYVQNASMEIAWTKTVEQTRTISGDDIMPFFTEGWEGFDINEPADFERAEAHAQTLLARV